MRHLFPMLQRIFVNLLPFFASVAVTNPVKSVKRKPISLVAA